MTVNCTNDVQWEMFESYKKISYFYRVIVSQKTEVMSTLKTKRIYRTVNRMT